MKQTEKYAKTRRHLSVLARCCALMLSVVLLAAYLPRIAMPVGAATEDEYRQQLEIIKGQLSQATTDRREAAAAYEKALGAYNDVNSEYADAIELKSTLDKELAALLDEQSAIEELLRQYNIMGDELRVQIEEKQKEVDTKYEEFKACIRSSYEDSLVSYLEIVFNAESFSDLLSRLDIVSSMMEYSKRVMNELDAAKQELLTKQLELQEMQKDAENRYRELDELEPKIVAKQEENAKLLNDLSEKLKAVKEAKDATAAELEKARKIESTYTAEQNAVEAEIEKIIRQRQEEEARRREEERKRQEQEGKEPVPIIDYSKKGFSWPLVGYTKVSSGFGMRADPFTGVPSMHNGVDIPAPLGTEVHASNSGTVLIATFHPSYGNYVVIDHGGQITTLYAHCSSLAVGVGQEVTKGQVIAYVGNTGSATGYHLHLSVLLGGSQQNPLSYVSP